ncbi:hypothetical protein K3495_g998 [Podosphaera aphanis]|nr:hypothetical protein K3495_g998 [Podosphaera aphanis]
MPRPNKRKRKHQNIPYQKARLDNDSIHDNSSDLVNNFVEQIYLNGLHTSSDDEFEVESLGSDRDVPIETTNAFDRILQKLKAEWIDESQNVRCPYQRGSVLCARDTSWLFLRSLIHLSKNEIKPSRTLAVLALLYSKKLQEKGASREDISLTVAKTLNKGRYFADRIRQWEHSWIEERQIAESRGGKNSKRLSWLNDEGVQLAVREWCSVAGEGITAYELAKAVGEYLNSTQREESIGVTSNNGFQNPSQDRRNDDSSRKIRSRTAQNWLKIMGNGL